MVILSFLQSELGDNKPLSNKDDLVFVSHIGLSKPYHDTITIIDTVFLEGVEVYDTTYDIKSEGRSMTNSPFNSSLILEYFSDLPPVERYSLFNPQETFNVYVNGVKLSIDATFTDHNYLQIFDYKILEGRRLSEVDIQEANPVMVISTKTAMNYFGTQSGLLGREIELEKQTYKIIGVFEHKARFIPYFSPDVIIPYTLQNLNEQYSYYFGKHFIIFDKESSATTQEVKNAIVTASDRIPLDHPDNRNNFETIEMRLMTFNEIFATGIYYHKDPAKGYRIVKWIIFGILLFFILLPTLNLINLNVSRIMERSSEIGVRKAFGANRGNIIFQFITENIVQTLIGGIMGLGLALLIIKILNDSGWLGNAGLTLYPKFFWYSFLATLFFGILSGLIPALKMSSLHIVKALKERTI